MKKVFIIIPFLVGCSAPKEKSQYEKFLDYEGKYEYVNKTTLDIVASEKDTTLYAVIDNAKYPLKHIKLDSFVNIANSPVVFQRNKDNEISSYKAGGEEFNVISKEFKKMEMFPRRALFHKPEDYKYKQPEETNDGLKTGALEDAFKNPESILNMVKETIKGEYPDVHSILIYKNSKLVLEEYFYGYDKDIPHQLRSASKSFIGGIFGIAVDKGFIKSEKEKIIPFFNAEYEEIKNMDTRKKEITIEDFLTYRSGLDCEDSNPKSKGNESNMMESEDWIKFTLDLPMVAEPGTVSSYCTGCSTTLGRLVELTTNKKIEDFAKTHFFEPMGIKNYDWTFEPNPSSQTTFNQMYLRPRDLLRLAKMYKDGGQWEGKQIISKDWVDKTFSGQNRNFGYLWKHKYFIVDGKQYNSYMATGNGGQKINIWPELDMITVFTGGNYNSYAIYGKSTPPNEMIPKYILKAL